MSTARGRSPNYIITQAFEDLPAGAFVRPIKFEYVPKETIELLGRNADWMNHALEVFCYTGKGMKVIPRSIIKEN